MKQFFFLALVVPNLAFAECFLEGRQYASGSKETFYYVAESKTVGPAYTCEELSRVRVCESTGNWSHRQPPCQDFDSGACADRWLDQLSDASFNFSSCR